MALISSYFKGMVICMVRIIPKPERRQDVLDLLQSLQGPTGVKSGCMECGIYEEYGKRKGILYVEQWLSQETLQEHIRSTMYVRVLSALELASEPPDIYFYDVSRIEGLDLIESLRSGPGEQLG